MPFDRFVDLDELVLECRTQNAKGYIAEAVAAYRAGAFRACIVMTWIAVVYDILDKLRELELTGDKNARQAIAAFDNTMETGNLPGALAFERKLLELAKADFALVSDVEHVALTRLQDDRNRCAHPSFFSAGDVYRPAPELARSHLRSAVEYLLRHAPMQGKAALDRVLAEIRSEYFPSTKQEALELLRAGPLARARPALARNLLIVLLKDLLTGELGKPAHVRGSVAMRALIAMHPEVAERTLSEKMNDLIVGLRDDRLLNGVATIYRVPETQRFLQENAIIKLSNFVINANEQALVLMFNAVLEIEFLKSHATARVTGLTSDTIAKLGMQTPAPTLPELNERIVALYESSGSFAEANTMAAAIANVAKQFDIPFATRVLRAATNKQVRYSSGFAVVLEAVNRSAAIPPTEFNRLLTELGVAEEHPALLHAVDADSAGPFGSIDRVHSSDTVMHAQSESPATPL